jgi:hypothetical protein
VRLGLAIALVGFAGACAETGPLPDIAAPPVLGKPFVAGAGDTVMDIKRTPSPPGTVGRTADAGRLIVRYVGLEGGQALFARQDVLIPSNQATMSRMPLIVPGPQKTAAGNVAVVPVSVVQTTTGAPYVPPNPTAFTPNQAGQMQLAAPPGGSVIVDGHRINFLRPVEGGIEYSVD